MKRFPLAILAIVALLSLAVTAKAGPPKTKKPEATGESKLIGVIIHTAKPYVPIIASIEELGGTVTIQYQNVDAVAAQVPADRFSELLALPGVDLVEKDYIVHLPPAPEEGLSARPLVGSQEGRQRKKAAETSGLEVLSADQLADLIEEIPATYYSYLSEATGAQDTWAETGAGADSLVAVIDTGTSPDGICLPAGRVIAGPDFSPDAGTPFEGSTVPGNHWHGTFVGSMIATSCFLVVPAGSDLGQAIMTHLPASAWFPFDGLVVAPLRGTAPASNIYAVKVFPHTGAGVPSSIIEAGLDHVISVKKSGTLDIDVVNMSLGGASLNDGRTLEEMLVDAATDAGITVVISAGNEGPAPVSVGSPGSAFSALTVAAASDTAHTRTAWDAIFGPGFGLALYPIAETRPADFSSRGPLGDGRAGPDVIATGVLNFGMFTPPFCGGPFFCFGWASGTSFSTPVVAGGVALLNAWAETNDPSIGPRALRNAIMDGAAPLAAEWSPLAQGHGFLNVPNSLTLLKKGQVNNGLRHDHVGELTPNVLLGSENTTSHTVTLAPARTVDWVFEITEETERVEIDIEIDGPIPPGPGAAAGFPNSFELYVKSAKRGGASYIIDSANVLDDASVVVGDGFVTLAGPIFGAFVDETPMEPGLMKVTLESDWTNNAAALTATVTIRRVQGAKESNAGGVTATIAQDEFQFFVIQIPPGTTKATFDLSWNHGWDKFPTADLDLLFASPSSFPFLAPFFDAATLNAPERQVIENPEAGLWFLIMNGFSVAQGRDPYILKVSLE